MKQSKRMKYGTWSTSSFSQQTRSVSGTVYWAWSVSWFASESRSGSKSKSYSNSGFLGKH